MDKDRDQTLWIKEVGEQAERAAKHEFVNGEKLTIDQYNHNHLWSALVTGLSEGYYTYKGSLTTPRKVVNDRFLGYHNLYRIFLACSETVTWIVGKKVLKGTRIS